MNVVLVVLDSVRRDRLGPYAPDVGFTETIDRFATEATVYHDAVAQAPWTLPSHASVFTGEYPWDHGATQRDPRLDSTGKTLAERFRRAGYRTACLTPNPWVSPYAGLTDGFETVDNFLGPSVPFDDRVVGRLLDWLSTTGNDRLKRGLVDLADTLFERLARHRRGDVSESEQVLARAQEFIAGDDPFFLFCNLMDAHEPYYPPESYRRRHAPDVDPSETCQIPSKHLRGDENADFDAVGKLYDASVDYLDDTLAGLFEALEDAGVKKETVVAVTADHGQALGEKGLYGHQYGVVEPLVSVPLLIRDPSGGLESVDRQVELRELYSLLPGLAGVRSEYTPGTERALGGYAFPDLVIKQIPDDLRDRYYRMFRFARGDGRRLTRAVGPDGTTDEMHDLGTDDQVPIDPDFSRVLDEVGRAETGSTDVDAPVEDRLEELGYL